MQKNTQQYLVFSKTHWDEPPRLRHQVVNLLLNSDNLVTFFEKPNIFFRFEKNKSKKKYSDNLDLKRGIELLHHQLRIFAPLRFANSLLEKSCIREIIKDSVTPNTRIINFNYDYYFLREIFPDKKIITIINDDFVAQAKFLKGRHVRKSLEMTCRMSDATLVVSYPLADQVQQWCAPHIFFPWADSKYTANTNSGKRDAILVWAHIDRRLDFNLLADAASERPDLKIHIVGPIANNVAAEAQRIAINCPNIVLKNSTPLSQLNLSEYFCSAIPYKKGFNDIEAVSMSNKTLQLLARGLPIITHGMPKFYDHSAIFKTNNLEEFLIGIDHLKNSFDSLQDDIKDFVDSNQPTNRLAQLEKIFTGT